MAKAVEESARPKPATMQPRQSGNAGDIGDRGQRQPGQHDLGGAKPENVLPHLPEPGGLQLEPDDEEQEDDAELRYAENGFRRRRCRAAPGR